VSSWRESGQPSFSPRCREYTYKGLICKGFLYMNFKKATDLLSVSLNQIASAVGKTYATVLAYRTGDRTPPPEVRAQLATFMREHADAVSRAADELDPRK
jgi:hypothetical protein